MNSYSSLNRAHLQDDSHFKESVAARLKNERQRIEPHQGSFAKKIGVPYQRQSKLENADGELRADYLAAIHRAGLDIIYILTGERTESVTFDSDVSAHISALLKLPMPLRKIVFDLAEALAAQDVGDKPPARDRERASDYATLHSPKIGYHGEEKR